MAQFPSQTDANGIWRINDLRNARMGSNWPLVGPAPVEYLVIAGGGSGGTYTPSSGYTIGNPGFNSVFATITSDGGGYGGRYNNIPGGPGGSGGGGGGTSSGGVTPGGPGTSGQGSDGGLGAGPSPAYLGGGGGGASAVGQNFQTSPVASGAGGDGQYSDITGTAVQRAGGDRKSVV